MSFVEAIKSAYRNYVNFSGRSQRSAYWWWVLFQCITGILIALAEGGGSFSSGNGSFSAGVTGGPISLIWMLVNLLPGIAVSIRRLHDLDKSGWWLLVAFIPLVGAIILLVWFCSKGTTGTNRFGSDPLGSSLT